MSDNHTAIEWTHQPGTIGETWNPTTGCDKVSAGCDNCYALKMAGRLKLMGQAKYQNDGDPRTSGPGFGLTVHEDTLSTPLKWRTPRTVFVNSMSDLFHARVPKGFVAQVWAAMTVTPQHTYQILTKRPERMARMLGHFTFSGLVAFAMNDMEGRVSRQFDEAWNREDWWPLHNVWLGTSIESNDEIARADRLRETPASVRFLSLEPLLGPLPDLNFTGIDWAIIGGESGPGARPMDLGWVRELVAMARDAGTAVFVKQMGTVWAGKGKGGDWSVWPEDLRIREYPQPRTLAVA